MQAKTAGVKGRSPRMLWAIMLWADGPTIQTVDSFAQTTVLEEYTHALDRRSHALTDCGCRYCEREATCISLAHHLQHVLWHSKFRRFLALRASEFPNFVDFRTTLSLSSQPLLMFSLVCLWKKVDPDLPYFTSSAFLAYEKEGKARQLNANKRAAKAAANKAEEEAASNAASVAAKAKLVAAEKARVLRYARSVPGVRIPKEYG